MVDLPDLFPLKVTQTPQRVGSRQLDSLDHLIAIVPASPGKSDFGSLPKSAQIEHLLKRARGPANMRVTTYLDNKRCTALTVAPIASGNCFELLTWARKLVAETGRLKSDKLGVATAGLSDEHSQEAVAALVRAADAAAFELPSFKSESGEKYRGPRSLKIFSAQPRHAVEALRRGTAGNNLARWLTALPPNKLTAASYRGIARTLARQYGLKYDFLGIDKLQHLAAGAFLAVAQGNASDDAGIIRLRYRPNKKPGPALALVGKGILFDTGGTNLKPFKNMLDMHTDMQGSAVALGIAIELAATKAPFAFDVWLAVTENRISATAYKSQDVVVATNGVSIQVIHTDAEGRMVLADTLALAANEKPKLIIDYATLTGTCVSALTTRYSGVFSNRAGSVKALLDAGMKSGERVWPFPLDDDFDEPLESQIADLKQCAVEGSGDHIFAARFLKRFVPEECAWVHIDLSAGQHKGGLGAVPTDITGFGVHYTLELLANHDPASLAADWS